MHSDNKKKIEIMTTQELNIANALLTAKEVLVKMLSLGFGEEKHLFAISSMLVDKFNLSQEESMIIIENALKLC